ncbi:YkvA family protein [Phyllobacterium sp. K27]
MDEIKIGEILEPGSAHQQRSREERVRASFWKTVRKAAKNIPFLDEVVAGYFCALDPATPTKVRGILLASLAYFVLPLDFIPDFILGLGFTDDVAVMMAALSAIRTNITPAHRAAARQAIADLDTDKKD